MLYRRFGRTELSMPVFSCGGMRYQESWEDLSLAEVTTKNQQNLEATICRALELGINHIETAHMYGTSEIQLGQLLPKLERSSFILQSKIAPDADVAVFRAKLEKSFSRLNVECIDLLSVHGINNDELWSWAPACVDVLKEYQKDGRIGHVGFSTHADTELISQVIESDLFDYVNLHWYYFLQKHDRALDLAQKHDMGVFVISPSDKGGRLYDPPEKLKDLCSPYTAMQFNDLFCLQDSRIHTLSLGAARPSDFDEHVEALAFLGRKEAIDQRGERIAKELRDVLGEDWMEACYEGLPKWSEAPSQINIFEVLRLYNLAVGLGMQGFAEMRYNIFEKKGHWFPGSHAIFNDEEMRQALRGHSQCEKIISALRYCHQNFHRPLEGK